MMIPAQTLDISSMKMHSVILSAPIPPYSSGKTIPSSPSSPSLGMISTGNFSLRSASSTSGSTSALANSRTIWRRSSCSSVKAKLSIGNLGPVGPPGAVGGSSGRRSLRGPMGRLPPL